MSKNKIVVPIDFSEQSLTALKQSYVFANEYSADLILLHILEDGLWHSLVSSKVVNDVKKEVTSKLKKLSEDTLKKQKISSEVVVAKGKAYEKIIEVADMVNATMIVMGSTSRKNLEKVFIGSNALRVVREANCPVISVKSKQLKTEFKNFVLPLDLSEETRDKVHMAIELVKLSASNITIHLMSALRFSDDFLEAKLSAQMEQVRKYIANQGVECTAKFITMKKGDKNQAESIMSYAKKVKGDLIIMMTQNETDITNMFIGSTAQEVVNNSDIPVLSIVPKKRKYRAAQEMGI